MTHLRSRAVSLDIEGLLGDKATYLLEHQCETISRDLLSLPGPDFVTDVLSVTDRSPQVMRNMQSLFNNGRLAVLDMCRFCQLTKA
jgi:class I fructose-bisphosphate aldolase